MNSLQQTIAQDVQRWLGNGQDVWLCTILETWGSSPRPVGSWLAVNNSGEWSGSVSGGCLEEDLIERFRSPDAVIPRLLDYGVTEDDREHFQLPCGGRIRLLVEHLEPDRDLHHIAAVLEAFGARRPVSRSISLSTGAVRIAHTEAPGASIQVGDDEVCHRLTPQCRLLLVGAGEVTGYVADFATAAGFETTVCEPRERFARGWARPQATMREVLPDDLVMSEFGDPSSAVLALAHDPRIDDMALLAALSSACFYVGAMGSVRTSAARRERLQSLGIDRESLARLRAPIGIDIPSKTPPEIAISVVADLISARYRLLASGGAL